METTIEGLQDKLGRCKGCKYLIYVRSTDEKLKKYVFTDCNSIDNSHFIGAGMDYRQEINGKCPFWEEENVKET